MPVVEESIVVQQPAGVVFDFLVDPSNLPVWESSVVETRQIGDGPMAVGTRSERVNKVLGVPFDWVSEVTELQRGRPQRARTASTSPSRTTSNRSTAVPG
ncbi:MAG TPA: SRPBCC family protein [Candidatus Nanopelagicales bacterium]